MNDETIFSDDPQAMAWRWVKADDCISWISMALLLVVR